MSTAEGWTIKSLDDTWAERDSEDESWEEYQARGGSLSAAGRRAAISAALPLLGTYFASGQQPLYSSAAVGRAFDSSDQDLVDSLVHGLRLRVALAAGQRLKRLLRDIARRPTFRYVLKHDEAVGIVSGQLDLDRYLTRFGVAGDPRTFPVITTQRAQLTPENTLAVYAAHWVLRELSTSLSKAPVPPAGPERRETYDVSAGLERLLQIPGLAACEHHAREIARKQQERRLVAIVERRLRRREVANPAPYRQLVAWVRESLDGAAPVSGDVDWSFYGDRFDTKLFEIWCLSLLAEEVSRQLAVRLPAADLSRRATQPVYVWRRPAGTLELYFQRSFTSLSPPHSSRWVRNDAGRTVPLGGVPDIIGQAIRHDGEERYGIIDPKLRQRAGAPTEELYKILGYLENHGLPDGTVGTVLFHATATQASACYEYHNDEGGKLFAISLNPVVPDLNHDGLARVASALLALLGIPPLGEDHAPLVESSRTPEEVAHDQVRARARELLAFADVLPAGTLNAYRRRIAVQLGADVWDYLSPSLQTILATAEYVGFTLDKSADFSGPVLGLCASIELLLFEHLIDPVTAEHPEMARYCRTLGQAIYGLDEALSGNKSTLFAALRHRIDEASFDARSLAHLRPRLADMNSVYRIPAAHRTLVAQDYWLDAWSLILNGEQALLPLLVRAFTSRSSKEDD